MTDAQLPETASAVDEPDAAGADPVNPYVTLTTLPSSAPVGTSSPNPYVTNITIVPTSTTSLQPTPAPHLAPSLSAEPDAAEVSPPAEPATPQPDPVPVPASRKPVSVPVPANARLSHAVHQQTTPARPGINAIGAVALIVAIIAAFSLLDGSMTSTGLALLMSVVGLVLGGAALLRRRESRRAATIALGISAIVLVISINSVGQTTTGSVARDDTIYGHPDSTRDGEGLGSYSEPHPLRSAFVVEDLAGQRWEVTVIGWQSDVTSQVRDIDRRNTAPGWAQFASVDVTYAYLGTDPEGAWWADLFVELSASDGRTYAENRLAGVERAGIVGSLLLPGEPLTVTSHFLLPSDAVEGSVLRLDTGERAVYAALE